MQCIAMLFQFDMMRFNKCWIVLKDSSKTDIKTKLLKSLILCLGCNICRAALRYNLSCWFEMQTKVSQLICPLFSKFPTLKLFKPTLTWCIALYGHGGRGRRLFDEIFSFCPKQEKIDTFYSQISIRHFFNQDLDLNNLYSDQVWLGVFVFTRALVLPTQLVESSFNCCKLDVFTSNGIMF